MLILFCFVFRFKFFVYSAYYDERVSAGGFGARATSSGVVRVIGATKTRGPEKVWCRLWYSARGSKNFTVSVTVAAKVKVRPFTLILNVLFTFYFKIRQLENIRKPLREK